MDSLSQAVLGASVGGVVMGRTLGRSALLGGALLGTLPDLDVLIDYGDAVANFTEHRGFSHSLLVLLPASLLLAWLLQRWRPAISLWRWWAFTGLCLLTHPLLDAFTTYGTRLFWPLGDPVAISSIFIIDPLYTLPLLVAVIVALVRPPAMTALVTGLTLSSLYLCWSLVAQQWMTQRVMPALADLLRPHQQRVDEISERMKYGMSQNIGHARSRFASSAGALRPSILSQRLARSQERFRRLEMPVALVRRPLTEAQQRLDALWRLAQQVSPDGPLKRGYARVSAADGALVGSRKAAAAAGSLNLHFADGTIGAQVTESRTVAKAAPKSPSSRNKKPADDRQQDLF